MRIGLVMDASCDLPQAYVNQHQITVLPIRIDIDGQVFLDRRDEDEVQRFLDENLGARSHSANTEPYTAEETQNLILEQLVTQFDYLLCLTITAARSGIHANITKASFGVLNGYHAIREQAGQQGQFQMRVIDTQSLFAGAGLVVSEAVRLLGSSQSSAEIRERLELIAHNTYGYMLPRDLHYLRARARKKGDRSVGLIGATLGSALDIKPILSGRRGQTSPVGKVRGFDKGCEVLFGHVVERISAGLLTPTICLSYGGDLAQLHDLPGYADLRAACMQYKVELLECRMSITGMVNVGEGAVTIGFASEEYVASF